MFLLIQKLIMQGYQCLNLYNVMFIYLNYFIYVLDSIYKEVKLKLQFEKEKIMKNKHILKKAAGKPFQQLFLRRNCAEHNYDFRPDGALGKTASY